MATGSNNAYRLSKLIVDGGTYLAKELTLQEIDKQGFATVDAFLNDPGINAKLLGLQRKNILKKQQMDLLYPTSSNVDVEQLDITLLTCILTNCFNLSPSQVTLVKDIRELRNTFYGHSPAFTLDDAKFKQNWKDVVTVLESGSVKHLKPHCVSDIKKMIKVVEGEILMPDMGERYIKQLIEWQRTAMEEQNKSIRDRITRNQSDIDSLRRHVTSVKSDMHGLKVWQGGEVSKSQDNGETDYFHRHVEKEIRVTQDRLKKAVAQNEEAIKFGLQTTHDEKISHLCGILERGHILVLHGLPGCGKTNISFSVMNELAKGGYTPLIVKSSSDLLKTLDIKRNFVIFIDDILGKFSVELQELEVLNRNVDELVTKLNQSESVLLCTSRLNVLKTTVDQPVYEKMLSKSMFEIDISMFNKVNLLHFYSKRKGLTLTESEINEISKVDADIVGFPVLCSQMFGEYEKIALFFKKPIEFIESDLEHYGKTRGIEYQVLLLLLLTDNKLDLHNVDNYVVTVKRVSEVSPVTIANLHSAVRCQIGTYLRCNNDQVCFTNDVILEAVFKTVCSHTPNILISYVPFKYLDTFSQFIIEKEHLWIFLAERLVVESDKRAVSQSTLLLHPKFIEWLLERKGFIWFFETSINEKSVFENLCQYGQCAAVELICNITSKCSYTNKIKANGLKYACIAGRLDILESLLSKGQIQVKDDLLFLAINSDKGIETTRMLLRNGCNILVKNKHGKNILESITEDKLNDYCEFLSLNYPDDFRHLVRKAANNNIQFAEDVIRLASPKLIKTLLVDCDKTSTYFGPCKIHLIHIAAKVGNLEALNCIINEDKDSLIIFDNHGLNALHFAAVSGSKEIVEYLIMCGIPYNSRTHEGVNILHIAARFGHTELVEYITKLHYDLLKETDDDGWNALHHAARGDNIACLDVLVRHGLRQYIQTAIGTNIIHIAAEWGSLKILKYIANKYKFLLKTVDYEGWNALHCSIFANDEERIAFLIDSGIPVKSITNGGMNILHIAVSCGNGACVERVIKQHGFLLQKHDYRGWTALHFATQVSSHSYFERLLQAGLDPYETTYDGYTILHIAAMTGDAYFLEKIFQRYSDMSAKVNTDGWNVLHWAVKGESLSCVRYLLRQGIPQNKTFSGSNILHIAAAGSNKEVLTFVIENFKELIDEVDNFQRNALHHAVEAESCTVEHIQLLVESGINVRQTDREDNNVLHLAVSQGNAEVIRYLMEHDRLLQHELNENIKFPFDLASEDIKSEIGHFFPYLATSSPLSSYTSSLSTVSLPVNFGKHGYSGNEHETERKSLTLISEPSESSQTSESQTTTLDLNFEHFTRDDFERRRRTCCCSIL